jgi:Zn-dependent M28 family amino/carboxypeptidase
MQVANQRTVNIALSDRYNDLNDPNQFYRRSDHWNFGRLGVPFIFFFNGVHDDYHQPSDEVDKIDFEALSKRTQLIYATSMMIANTDERPLVDNQEFIERTRR